MSIAIGHERQRGITLIITALVLVLVSMLVLSSIGHSERESTGGARSRSTTRAFYGADSGVNLALGRLGQTIPDLSAFSVSLIDATVVESRSRGESTPQDLEQAGLGEVAEGWGLNAGSGIGYINRIYVVNVTSTSGGSTIELEAKLVRGNADAVSY